ncbi:hypothetical protein P3875_06640 [Myroides sp. JBRI-B21084]|uniref:hypothetical protein n=1 Tax=Myroides sp. JBRI-B21084 TaxID=3119977 RepID=UPI0026E16467|nr:hypothetical protein [Paenimyroides cloacae]WKW45463.1 hypothetical protein P3875_06640 [Paenimyroides cloacae]
MTEHLENTEPSNSTKPVLTTVFLAPYLPYGLKGNYLLSDVVPETKHELRDKLLTTDNFDFFLKYAKPILRPIQEVEQYFERLYGSLEHQDVTDYFDADFLESHDNIEIEEIQLLEAEQLPYGTLKVLLKHHFDVFDLISKGLAISIHDVE